VSDYDDIADRKHTFLCNIKHAYFTYKAAATRAWGEFKHC